MLALLPITDKLQLVTSAAGDIDVQVTGVDWTVATAVSSLYRLNTTITTAATTDVAAAPASGVERSITHISIHNTHASISNTINMVHVGNVTIDLKLVTLLPGEELVMAESGAWYHYDAFGGVKSANSTVSLVTCKELTADQSNSTITPTNVTGLSQAVGVGTYAFEYYIRYQAAAATTGVKFDVNHTGTVTSFIWNQYWSDLSATASTAVPDQDNIGAAGHVMGTFASRAKGTAGRGVTLSVDTINADMFMRIEGLMVVTVAGNLELWHGSEVAAASTVKAGSGLILTKISA